MRHVLSATALIATVLAAVPAMASIERREAEGDFITVLQRLETTVATAGAQIVAKVDHAEGALSEGVTIPPEVLVIFGSPALGTPAIQDDPLAGLYLPMKVLVYQDSEGKVWLAYEEPGTMFGDLGIDDNADYVQEMTTILDGFVKEAAGN